MEPQGDLDHCGKRSVFRGGSLTTQAAPWASSWLSKSVKEKDWERSTKKHVAIKMISRRKKTQTTKPRDKEKTRVGRWGYELAKGKWGKRIIKTKRQKGYRMESN